ncbi:tRNA-dihydrouridine synthase [Kiloniella laminariae]|uniref:tRNA-dihydrouridine(16) synthase n=1 Tax=Kiloniella laminariae TaxID=454162 RepID=A0ABT4LJH7_9PROT|nr:tRNA-dihydrouridine synthase [Kiloniella laminariae]MCZ4281260.1 tRNA-dihydrouridine synthase [Kiloniella laminariae]
METATVTLILAPMEGLVDPQMRKLLTAIGGIDRCVTEFIRVNDQTLPAKMLHRLAPELHNQGRTASGVPVSIQLLGSNPETLSEAALLAVELGAPAIDLNFGCPSKTVNKNKGGSVLLKEPDIIHKVVKAVRESVPSHIPVTAKMRLGYEDKSLALENAHAIESAGANEVCVHARTKLEGYRRPAHWEWIARIREAVKIKVIANGDICSLEDYRKCRSVSGCDDVMIGRGLIAWPDLALVIASHNSATAYSPMTWDQLFPILQVFYEEVRKRLPAKHSPGRLKQWLVFLKQHYPEAQELFDQIRSMADPDLIQAVLSPPPMKKAG